MALSREEMLRMHHNLPAEEVAVPEWGDGATVRIRCLTVKEREDWAKLANSDNGPSAVALLVATAAVDDDGKQLFHAQDADALGNLRGDVMQRIADVVGRLSGLGEAAAEAAAGNSDATQSGASLTDSPATSDAPSPN